MSSTILPPSRILMKRPTSRLLPLRLTSWEICTHWKRRVSLHARRFVFASTIYVYSESGSFYRASKQAAERFIETYHERYDLDYSILRYGSLYGRRADARNGIYRMLHEALERHSITYHGSGEAIREYIHVEDAARMSVQVLAPEFANRHLILTGQERLRIKGCYDYDLGDHALEN